MSAYGAYKNSQSSGNKYQEAQTMGGRLMKTGQDPYQAALMQLLGKATPANAVSTNTGSIDASSILSSFNPGQDALMQFLRADPSKQTSFDTSLAFDNLQALDKRNQDTAIAGLNANFGGLGQRFGTSAMHQTSDLLANMGAQTGARNAGILQSSFESAQQRRMAGLGLTLQGAQSLSQGGNAMAQLAAQLGIANQGNTQFYNTFNQNNRNTAFQQQLAGLQAGFGMQNANDQINNQLFSIMQGMAMPQGNAYTAAGSAGMDISQLMLLLPMLKGGKAA
jgi:hypothetical protein